jgi:carbon-monoxide dehydrogenase large subunit
VLERLSTAARGLRASGRDEIRRRNYIRPEQIPYRNAAGNAIDSGRFAETQDMALARRLGRLPGAAGGGGAGAAAARGIGLGYFIEASGGQPSEWARVRFEPAASWR